jgi:hypothetical protein
MNFPAPQISMEFLTRGDGPPETPHPRPFYIPSSTVFPILPNLFYFIFTHSSRRSTHRRAHDRVKLRQVDVVVVTSRSRVAQWNNYQIFNLPSSRQHLPRSLSARNDARARWTGWSAYQVHRVRTKTLHEVWIKYIRWYSGWLWAACVGGCDNVGDR